MKNTAFGDGLRVDLGLEGDIGRLDLVGELTADAASEVLLGAVTEVLASGAKGLQLRLGGVDVMDSSGLALLLRVRERLRLPNIPLQLVGLSPVVAKVLDSTAMTSVFEVIDSPGRRRQTE